MLARFRGFLQLLGFVKRYILGDQLVDLVVHLPR